MNDQNAIYNELEGILICSVLAEMLNRPYICFVNTGATTYIRDVAATAELLKQNEIDAIEIHTTGR